MPTNPEQELIHKELDTDAENAATEVATVVANLEEKGPADIATIYGCVDGALDRLFSDPPTPEAQMEVTFSYEGYRITVEQDGSAKFVKTR